MNLFTEVYSSIISILQTKSLDGSWTSIEAELKALCQNDGPSDTKAECLKKARDKIENTAGIWDYITSNSDTAHAEEILKAAQTKNVGFQKRAGLSLFTIEINSLALSTILFGSNETFPIEA